MPDNRLKQLKTMLEGNPHDAFLLYAIAKEYEGLGDMDSALDFFLGLKERQPDYVGLYYHLGKVLEKQGEATQAFHTYKQGMAIAQKLGDTHAFSELATAKLELGDDEDFD